MNAPETAAQANLKEGLNDKFIVTRTDETDKPGGKHHGDKYFVLNLTTDPFALPALAVYSIACAEHNPALSKDLRAMLNEKAEDRRELVMVPSITLPNGTIVPAFKVGKYHCSKDMGDSLVVDPTNTPTVNINYHKAREACTQAGLSLITELQYLAIAHDIVNQDANWTGGKVGEGKVFQGLHKGNMSEAQDGEYESSDPEERRWHVLSNGERIYDFAGNVFSWVFDDVQGDENGIIASDFAKDSPTRTTAPYSSREKGIGDTELFDWTGSALVRGGCWRSSDFAGVFYLRNGWPDYSYSDVGFRCTKSL